MAKRIDLRNWLADRMDDYFEAPITVPAIGALSTLTISSPRLSQADESYWKGADLSLARADGTYETRRVTGYQPTLSGLTGGILTLESALASVPSTSDTFYLYRKAPVTSYNRAISAALRHASDQTLVECLHTNTALQATTSIWRYTVPTTANIERILDVGYKDQANYDERKWLTRYQWEDEREGGLTTLILRNDTLVPATYSLVVRGMGPPLDLTSDGQELEEEVPTEYVVDYAVGELRLARWTGTDPEDSARQATFMKQMAEAKLRGAQRFSNRGRLRRRW